MNDPRENLPSASGIFRIRACPGSWNLSKGLPNHSTADSLHGDAIHAALAGKGMELTPDQQDVAAACQDIEAKVVVQWLDSIGCAKDWDFMMPPVRDSERLWLWNAGKKVCSGQGDVIYIHQGHALILDFKTLPGDHADADGNDQLRTLAVLVDYDVNGIDELKSTTVAIIQPLVTHSPLLCRYDSPDLNAAHAELLTLLDGAEQPDAPLKTGKHCNFCPAKLICSALKAEQEMMLKLPEPALLSVLTDEEVEMALDVCGRLTKKIVDVKGEAMRRVQANPELWKSFGWEMKEGAGRETITDVATVSERLHEKGASWEAITAACSITKKALESLVRGATGEKGMGLKKTTEGILDGCTATKPTKPQLKRIGSTEDEEE